MALLVAMLLAASATPAANLVLNRSIEQYHGLGRPFAWEFRKNAASKVNTSAARARTGRNSLELDLSVADGPEWDSRRYPVAPGRSYRASFHYRVTEAFTAGELFTFVRWWADDSWSDWQGQSLLEDGIGKSTTPGWVEVSRVVTAPAGARYGEIHLWSVDSGRGPNGRVFLDDFSLSPVAGGARIGSPSPSDGAEAVPLYTVLTWDAVPSASEYDLYLGTDFETILAADRDSPEYVLSIPVNGLEVRYAASLAPYTGYFWRADPVVDGRSTRSEVLSFSTSFDLLETIAGADGVRYGGKDSQGRGLDTLQVIENPSAAGYIGVYHSFIEGEFEVRLATSTDLLNWTFRRTLAANADMPAIATVPDTGGFVLAHEQWGNPGSRSPSNLRFRYYPSYSALLAGNGTRDYLAPLTVSAAHQSNLEGTPGILSVSADGNRIEVGFHFYDAAGGGVDRNATGTLLRLLSGTSSWSTRVWDELNQALIAHDARANVGDRDEGFLFGQRLMVIEGQYTRGDFGSWRGWFWDFRRKDVFPLLPRTAGDSTAVGNLTWEVLTSPGGKRAICGAGFFFSEGAAPGEAGEAIYYNELVSEAWGPSPADGAGGVEPEPTLYWLSAAGAVAHDLYFGSDAADVARATRDAAEYRGRLAEPLESSSTASRDGRVPLRLEADTLYAWRVDEVFADGSVLEGDVWTFRTAAAAGGRLLPGDCNLDGQVDLSDAICILGLLFLGDSETPCGGSFTDASNTALLDWNGDGALDVSDAISVLGFLFGSSSGPHVLGRACVSIPGCPHACP